MLKKISISLPNNYISLSVEQEKKQLKTFWYTRWAWTITFTANFLIPLVCEREQAICTLLRACVTFILVNNKTMRTTVTATISRNPIVIVALQLFHKLTAVEQLKPNRYQVWKLTPPRSLPYYKICASVDFVMQLQLMP